jgi:basic membrane protein A
MSAAAEAEGKVIGVDVDQRYDSETVITSAMKGLATSVIDVLESIYKTDSWNTYSGKSTYFNAANDGVGLPTIVIDNPDGDAFDRFETFGKADYDALFAAVAAGDLGIIREIQVADAAGNATADELVAQLGLEKVTVRIRR